MKKTVARVFELLPMETQTMKSYVKVYFKGLHFFPSFLLKVFIQKKKPVRCRKTVGENTSIEDQSVSLGKYLNHKSKKDNFNALSYL